MSAQDTARGLHLIADLLEGLPGLPLVNVTVFTDGDVMIQVIAGDVDDATRTNAVDMILALVGGTATVRTEGDHESYGGHGDLGERAVDVFAPRVTPTVTAAAGEA